MIQQTTAREEYPAEFGLLVFGNPRVAWRELANIDVEFPHELIAVDAYCLHLQRGGQHGFDVDDWFMALAGLRSKFRRFVASLNGDDCVDCNGYFDSLGGTATEFPKSLDVHDAYRRSGDAICESEEIVVFEGPKLDEFGNLWPTDRPRRCELSANVFNQRFADFTLVVVDIETDEIYAAGTSEEALEQGLAQRDLDAAMFQLEPGPFGASGTGR